MRNESREVGVGVQFDGEFSASCDKGVGVYRGSECGNGNAIVKDIVF